jgi:two-component system, chemotaxis family, chemotaxis protein CheY
LLVTFSQSCSGLQKEGGPIASAKILIVDGEYPTRKTLRGLLLALGCSRIHETSDGEKGLEAIRALLPDLVLLDWDLPGMGGATFVRRLRSGGSPHAGVPIVTLVQREERGRVLEAVRLGVHEFLLKPVSSSALKSRLMSALGKTPAPAKREEKPHSKLRKLAS